MHKPENCVGCSLCEIGESFTLSEGQAKFGVNFVGESAGKHEAQEGGPFRRNGESGSLITNIIEEKIILIDNETGKPRKARRSDFSWDNVVKCRPPNDKLNGEKYEKEAIEHCRIYNGRSYGAEINRDFRLFDDNSNNGNIHLDNSSSDHPFNKVIVALGATAFKELTGISGKKRGIEDLRGYVFRSSTYNALIIGALHPSFIRHGNSRFTGSLIYDIKKSLLVANGSYTSYDSHPNWNKPEFVLSGKLEALVGFYYKCKENSGLTIYYDIENPYTKGEEEEDKGDEEDEANNGQESGYEITSIQFGTDTRWAITVPWEKPFIKVALAILALGNDKVGANVWHHDNPRLEANGAKIGGKIHDLMWAWHHLQSGLWKGLQRIGSFFDVPYAWKHLALESGNEDEYGCMDVIAPAYIWPKLIVKMKAMGVWDSYLKFKVEYREVLKATEQRGLFVDIEEHGIFKEWVTGEVNAEDILLQQGIPEELRNIEPNNKSTYKKTGESIRYGYIREPPIIKQFRTAYNLTRDRMLLRGIRPELIMQFEKWAESKSGLTYKEFGRDGSSDNQELGVYSEGEGNVVKRWCKVEPFKASSQQLIKYLKFKGYPVPKTLKEGRETTGKKELQEVWERTGDELLGSVIRIRSYNKMLSNDIPNWLPDKDGVVRTTFKFDPPSWQLNSIHPNIQNASKHPKEWELYGKVASELTLIGQRFRKIVKAPKGRCVVEFDKSGFHVSMMGFEARDPLYLKWANHMHTVFTSYIVGEPIPIEGEIDYDKLDYIKKKFKVVRDSQSKPTVLGNQLGLGHVKLHYNNRTYIDSNGIRQIGIESRKRAKYLQEMLASLFPKVENYKKKIKEEAHFKGYLMSSYKALRWFFDAMRWDYKTRSMKNGSEAEEAQSHNIQADAFGMIHSEILDMARTSDILEEHHFANTIHDSLIFFPEVGKLDKCIEDVVKYMRKPEKLLVDLVCCPEGLVVDVDVMASCEAGNWANWHKERNPDGIREIKL